jgi:hypothetical protein
MKMREMLRKLSKGRKSDQEIDIKSYVRIPIHSGYEIIKSAQITPAVGDSDPSQLFSSILREIASFAPTLSLEMDVKELTSNFTLFYSIQSHSEKDGLIAIEVLQDRLNGVFESKGFRWESHTSTLKDRVYSLFIEAPLSTTSNRDFLKVRTDNLRFYLAILGIPLSSEGVRQLVNNAKLLNVDGLVTLRFRPLELDNVSYIGPITQFGELVMNQWEAYAFITVRSLTKKRLTSLISYLEKDNSLTKISKLSLKKMLQRDVGPFDVTSHEHLATLLACFVVGN